MDCTDVSTILTRDSKPSHLTKAKSLQKQQSPLLPQKRPYARFPPNQIYNCTSSFTNRTSSPGLNAGSPIYGHPSQRKASPSAQFPQLPTLPCTVKSTSARSSAPSFSVLRAWSAVLRLAASSASIFCFRPHVQSLQARRRLPDLGRHSGAERGEWRC